MHKAPLTRAAPDSTALSVYRVWRGGIPGHKSHLLFWPAGNCPCRRKGFQSGSSSRPNRLPFSLFPKLNFTFTAFLRLGDAGERGVALPSPALRRPIYPDGEGVVGRRTNMQKTNLGTSATQTPGKSSKKRFSRRSRPQALFFALSVFYIR